MHYDRVKNTPLHHQRAIFKQAAISSTFVNIFPCQQDHNSVMLFAHLIHYFIISSTLHYLDLLSTQQNEGK
jgi:hypothetical protein